MGSLDRQWPLTVVFTDHDRRTRADVVLDVAGRHYHGWGTARRAPTDPDVPRMGRRLPPPAHCHAWHMTSCPQPERTSGSSNTILFSCTPEPRRRSAGALLRAGTRFTSSDPREVCPIREGRSPHQDSQDRVPSDWVGRAPAREPAAARLPRAARC